ncbi:MAG: nodulation protein NfeD [candidate division Zixibacteria bacterium]|nr:nodulation protein NfeD [candidate division Zixibacteria bacterium]
MRRSITLVLFGLLLLSPLVAFTLRATPVEDAVKNVIDAVTDTGRTDIDDIIEQALPTVVYTLKIDGVIGVVTDARIEEAVEYAEDEDAELLVIQLNTPGGFVAATWSICESILNADIPVCVYISPEGARAGSAGVYMTYAAHIAAMAPATNIGAAHPVSGGEAMDSVMNEKVTNDAVAQIKAAAQRRGRNAEWAEQAVRESVSITSNEALENNVIDLIASDINDLLRKLNGRAVEVSGTKRTLELDHARVEPIKRTFIHRFLEVITFPDIAFLLLAIGGLGITVEIWNPGAIFPGVVGAIATILAFYAFSILPINYAGVALIMLAFVLFIAEIKIASAGLLTVGGVISLFLGGMMLIDTVEPALRVSWTVLVTVSVFVGVVAGAIMLLVVKASKRQPFSGRHGMIGKIGEVRGNGMIYLDGALWKIECDEPLEVGQKVVVVEVDSLKLIVKKKS